MYCPVCKKQNTGDANFCENCGMKFDTDTRTIEFGKNTTAKIDMAPSTRSSTKADRSSIIDHVDDIETTRARDQISGLYYLLSFVFWPLGIFLWAFHRSNQPESAKNVLASTIAGFVVMLLIFLS